MKDKIIRILKEETKTPMEKVIFFLLNKFLINEDVEQILDSNGTIRFVSTSDNTVLARYDNSKRSLIVEYRPVWYFIDENLSLPYEVVQKHISDWFNETFDYPNVEVSTTGSVEYNHRQKLRKIRERRKAEERRSNDEWADYPLPFALMEHLKNEGDWEGPSDDEVDDMNSELNLLRDELGNLDPESDEYGDIESQIEEIEDRLSEVEDVYNIIPNGRPSSTHGYFSYGGMEFLVTDDDTADELAFEYTKNSIEETGIDAYPEWLVQNNIDTDYVESFFRDYYDSDIRENPEIYLDDDDRELTSSAERRIREIEDEISELNDRLEDEDEDHDEINEEIEELQSELDYIIDDDDSYEYSEDKIDEMIEDKLYDVKRNPLEYLKEFGQELTTDMVDLDGLAQDILDSDGRGHMLASYDGSEYDINYDGTWYYIYRTN